MFNNASPTLKDMFNLNTISCWHYILHSRYDYATPYITMIVLEFQRPSLGTNRISRNYETLKLFSIICFMHTADMN